MTGYELTPSPNGCDCIGNGYTVKILPPKCKDYNEQLIAYAAQKTETRAMKR